MLSKLEMHLCKQQVHPVEEYQNITLTVNEFNECDLWRPQEECVRRTII